MFPASNVKENASSDSRCCASSIPAYFRASSSSFRLLSSARICWISSSRWRFRWASTARYSSASCRRRSSASASRRAALNLTLSRVLCFRRASSGGMRGSVPRSAPSAAAATWSSSSSSSLSSSSTGTPSNAAAAMVASPSPSSLRSALIDVAAGAPRDRTCSGELGDVAAAALRGLAWSEMPESLPIHEILTVGSSSCRRIPRGASFVPGTARTRPLCELTRPLAALPLPALGDCTALGSREAGEDSVPSVYVLAAADDGDTSGGRSDDDDGEPREDSQEDCGPSEYVLAAADETGDPTPAAAGAWIHGEVRGTPFSVVTIDARS
mmetsp:Transcript_24828/g.74698  ORF Transcript_24828/g.74698 Transcript_24828/m.74698 type:complete len:326 (-) Transcript_24828:666-1643(-)